MSAEIVVATQHLADMLAAENAALLALDLPAAGRLLPQKQAATLAFSKAQRAAVAVRGTIDSKALRIAATRLQSVAEENRILLERAINVQNHVLGILASAARAADPAPRYGRSGAYAVRLNASWALTANA